ncbi:MAG: hypothetical protein HWE20_17235 [Gammaproteobacteria bacterium]|nr:hypothetical protein [Gammaproteobacteria bacterium]
MAIKKLLLSTLSLCGFSGLALAEMPHQLRNGQPASASEVMANFDYVNRLVKEGHEVEVDCGSNADALRQAYLNLPAAGLAAINFKGACEGAIGVERSGTVFRGIDDSAVIYVDGGSDWVNPGWQGAENPLALYIHAVNVHLENLRIERRGDAQPGSLVFVGRNGDARMVGVTIDARGVMYSAVGVHQNSTLRLLEDNTLHSDASDIIELSNTSALLLRGKNDLYAYGDDTVGIRVGATSSIRTYSSDGRITLKHMGNDNLQDWIAGIQARTSGGVNIGNHALTIEGFPKVVDARGGSAVEFNNWDQQSNLISLKGQMQIQTGASVQLVGAILDTGNDRLDIRSNGSMIARDGTVIQGNEVEVSGNGYMRLEEGSSMTTYEFRVSEGAVFESRNATMNVSGHFNINHQGVLRCNESIVNMSGDEDYASFSYGATADITNCIVDWDDDAQPNIWISRGAVVSIAERDDRDTSYVDSAPNSLHLGMRFSVEDARLEFRDTQMGAAQIDAHHNSQVAIRGGSILINTPEQCAGRNQCGAFKLHSGSSLTLQNGNDDEPAQLLSDVELYSGASLSNWRDRINNDTEYAGTISPDEGVVTCNGDDYNLLNVDIWEFTCGIDGLPM